jgi:hypothetical protein
LIRELFRLIDESTDDVFQAASQLPDTYNYRVIGTDTALKAGEAIKELFSASC